MNNKDSWSKLNPSAPFSLLAILTLLMAATPLIIYAEEYLLPEADYRPDGTAEACFDGEIYKTSKDKLFVTGISNKSPVSEYEVKVTKDTNIFTIYGGFVSPHQLQAGIKLKIWYLGDSCSDTVKPLTCARIMIASEKPGDEWP